MGYATGNVVVVVAIIVVVARELPLEHAHTGAPPSLFGDRDIAATPLVYTNNRAFSANKKKKSSRRPVQSCCDNNCLATRGVGSRGTTDLLSSLPRL